MAVKIVECFSVSPSHGAVPTIEQSLPLAYLDMLWFKTQHTKMVYFYTLKCSESHFLETIVLQLKQSLALTLKHFLPLAGKIVFPLTSTAMPVFRYTACDSVPLTIAVSDADFADMTGNHSRAPHHFHCLVPRIPPSVYSQDDIKISCIPIQATFFPNQGICIGFTQHHAVCDGRSQVRFIQAWALVNKLNSDHHLVGNALPSYDRSRVQNSKKLESIGWERAKMDGPTSSLNGYLPPEMVRTTFILTDNQIKRLKKIVMMKKRALGRVSTFAVVCAYFWTCLAKSREGMADDEIEWFVCPVDCRRRLEPPLPENYFGNCVVDLVADSTNGKLRRNNYDGFVAAVEVIVGCISKTFTGREVAEIYENTPKTMSQLNGKKVAWFVGSTRLMDHYDVDYGWGRPTKYELLHIDFEGLISLCKGRDGGVEIGLALPKPNMDALAAIFNQELYINSKL